MVYSSLVELSAKREYKIGKEGKKEKQYLIKIFNTKYITLTKVCSLSTN